MLSPSQRASSRRPAASPLVGFGSLSKEHAYTASFVAAVAVCTAILSSDQRLILSVREAWAREPRRLRDAVIDVADDILDHYSLPSLLVNLVLFGGTTLGLVKGYLALSAVVREAWTRRKARLEGVYSHATSFKERQNAQMNTNFAT